MFDWTIEWFETDDYSIGAWEGFKDRKIRAAFRESVQTLRKEEDWEREGLDDRFKRLDEDRWDLCKGFQEIIFNVAPETYFGVPLHSRAIGYLDGPSRFVICVIESKAKLESFTRYDKWFYKRNCRIAKTRRGRIERGEAGTSECIY